MPEAITFATKPQLALAMIERAIQAEVPFAWVVANSIYGVGEIELALRRAYKGYVLGVTGQHHFWSWDANLDVACTAADIAKSIPDQDWLWTYPVEVESSFPEGGGFRWQTGSRLLPLSFALRRCD